MIYNMREKKGLACNFKSGNIPSFFIAKIYLLLNPFHQLSNNLDCYF